MTAEVRRTLLDQIYATDVAARTADHLERLLARRGARPGALHWDERDVWLITYPDQFQKPGEHPLATLLSFYERRLSSWINGIHILPFYPWSSDDGFSVIDYRQVDERYGTWEEIEAIASRCRLMVDAVINHMSSESTWFQAFLAGDHSRAGFFKTADPTSDFRSVVRPRTHPLLTRYESVRGPVHVWTTFSADQVDLDYGNPAVLLDVIDLLIGYAERGAQVIRLDAIGFLWKEIGTSSIHLPQTHAVIQLMRACLDVTHPDVILISETNVPHAENVSYLGRGTIPEAQAVYQFSLPPLTLHSMLTGDSTAFSEWAVNAVDAAGPGRTFFNFLASHDGIGIRPVEGILSDREVAALVDACRSVEGGVNLRVDPDGAEVPYELNTTWYDAMTHGVDEDLAIRRHLASHDIMLAMPGIPGLYVQSLFGGRNDVDGARRTGMNRSLNRRRFDDVAALQTDLTTTGTRTNRVFEGLKASVAVRNSHPAFHPGAAFSLLDLDRGLIGIERTAGDGSRARCVVNVTDEEHAVETEGWRVLTGPDHGILSGVGSIWLSER